MPPKTPLLHPTDYFESRVDPILPGLGVFAAYLMVEFIVVIWFAFWLLGRVEDLPGAAGDALWNLVPSFLVAYLVVGLIALVAVTVIMHYVSGGDKTGGLVHTLAVAGWAYAPNLLAVPVSIAWVRWDLRDLTLQADNPAALEAELERLSGDVTGIFDLAIEFAVIAWSVVILAYGVAAIHEIDVDETWPAALLVGIGALLLGLIF